MPSDAAAIPLTYDSADLQDADLGLFLEITQGLNEPPEPRGEDVLVPYADGRSVRPRRPDSLRIVLLGHVMGQGSDTATRRADFRTTMKYLATLFDPSRTPANLVATLEDGSTATIAARPLPMLVVEQIPSEFATVSIELLSVAPEWTYTGPGS